MLATQDNNYIVKIQTRVRYSFILRIPRLKCGSTGKMRICGHADLRIQQRVKCGRQLRIFSADLTGKMLIRMRIFGRQVQTAMSYLCALCQLLPLSFVDADDDYDDDYSNQKIVIWLLCYLLFYCCFVAY